VTTDLSVKATDKSLSNQILYWHNRFCLSVCFSIQPEVLIRGLEMWVSDRYLFLSKIPIPRTFHPKLVDISTKFGRKVRQIFGRYPTVQTFNQNKTSLAHPWDYFYLQSIASTFNKYQHRVNDILHDTSDVHILQTQETFTQKRNRNNSITRTTPQITFLTLFILFESIKANRAKPNHRHSRKITFQQVYIRMV
jgi:hypothetical protein